MDQFKDLLNNIKDRFANPLFFSFICSWLVVNWTIPISLLWYDTNQIEKAGFSSIYELILCQLSMKHGLCYPIILAFAYTILAPIFKNAVRLFYTFINQLGENWNLIISKDANIPFEKYLKLRENYDKRSKILEDVIKKENEYITENNKISTELLNAKATINKLNQEKNESAVYLNQQTDLNILNGFWTNTFTDTIGINFKGSEEVFIEDGRYYIISAGGQRQHTFNIVNFFYDKRNNSMFFIKERIDQTIPAVQVGTGINVKFNPNVLRVQNNRLVGRENGIMQIEYIKKEIQ